MAPDYPVSSRIVKQEPGRGTCDTIYTDEHGRRWLSGPGVRIPSGSGTTAEAYGEIRPGGYIVRKWR